MYRVFNVYQYLYFIFKVEQISPLQTLFKVQLPLFASPPLSSNQPDLYLCPYSERNIESPYKVHYLFLFTHHSVSLEPVALNAIAEKIETQPVFQSLLRPYFGFSIIRQPFCSFLYYRTCSTLFSVVYLSWDQRRILFRTRRTLASIYHASPRRSVSLICFDFLSTIHHL